MNIQKFVAYLNRLKGWHIEGAYYSEIIQWRDWWRGDYAPFHTVKEMTLKGNTVKRPMYRLRMPKRACEDWASLLLNDKTTLTVADTATARWLCGEDAGQTGGVLGALDFWPHANELVELAFRSGTGAFVMSCEGLQLAGGQVAPSPAARLALDYLPAECILPITIRHGSRAERVQWTKQRRRGWRSAPVFASGRRPAPRKSAKRKRGRGIASTASMHCAASTACPRIPSHIPALDDAES